MKIGGLQKLTLIDFPDRLAATVFLCGCNFHCRYCYNSELVLPQKIKNQLEISEKELFDFLKEKKGLLEGLTISGGEPTINKDLKEFIKKIKNIGYLVKLDTNGSNPKILEDLIDKKLVDYLALDIKSPKEKYNKICKKRVNLKNIERSIKILKESEVEHEFRTTVIPGLIKENDVLKIARWIGPAQKYFLQNFRPEKTLDPKFEKIKPYSQEFLLAIQRKISPLFEVCQVR